MIDIVALLVASVTLHGVTGVVAAPDFVPPAVANSVTLAPVSADPVSDFRANDRLGFNSYHARVDASLLPQLGGRALLDQLALLDHDELAGFVETNADAVDVLLLDPPAASHSAAWWSSLPTEAQRVLESAAPELVGNLPGVPYATRDAVNRALLEDTLAGLEAEASAGAGLGGASEVTAHLNMLHQIELALEEGAGEPERALVSLDTAWPGRAAVVIGDLIDADFVSYLVPGMFFTIEGQVVDWAETALELYHEQEEWLTVLSKTAPEFSDKTVATVAWMGYETPNLFTVGSEELADQGALYLDSAMDGLLYERAADRPFVSFLAHSYGSTAAMKALATGNFEVDSLALVGSPGSAARSVDDLHVRGRNVFVGEASWDPVAGTGFFGNDPGSADYGAHRMSVAGGVDLITDEVLGASVGHNGYFAPNSESMRNMALISIDRGSLVTDGTPQDVQRTLAYFDSVI